MPIQLTAEGESPIVHIKQWMCGIFVVKILQIEIYDKVNVLTYIAADCKATVPIELIVV